MTRIYERPAKPSSQRAVLTGFCESSRNATPYDDKDVTIFGLNRGYTFMSRIDYFFEMHGPAIYRWKIRRPEGHLEWMQRFKGPIFQHLADPEIPNSIAYPLQAISDFVGQNIWRLIQVGQPLVSAGKNPYLTSSIAYQIALAMYEGFEQIELYGIDLNTGGEYAWQKSGVEYLLGMAAGRGHKIILPGNCPLLGDGKLYGRGFLKPEGEQITKPQLEVRLKELQAKYQKTQDEFHQITGALMEARHMATELPGGVFAEKQDQRIRELVNGEAQVKARVLAMQGSLQEILNMISWTPDGQPGDQAIAQLETGQLASYAPGEDGGLTLVLGEPIAGLETAPAANGHEQTIEAELVAVAGG